MSGIKTLRSTITYTIIGTLPVASSLLLLPFFTNFLSTADYGRLSLYIGFTLLVQVLTTFGLDSWVGVVFHKYSNNANTQKTKISNLIGFSFYVILVSIVFWSIIGPLFFKSVFILKEGQTSTYAYLATLTGIISSPFKILTSLYINKKNPTSFFWTNLIYFILIVALTIGGMYIFPNTLIGPIVGRLLATTIITIYAIVKLKSWYGITYKIRIELKEILAFCSPLVVYFLLAWIVGNIDRYIILHFLTANDMAVFDFAIKATMILDLFINAITYSVNPTAYEALNKSPEEFHSKVNNMFAGINALVMVAITGSALVLPLIIPIFIHNSDLFASYSLICIISAGYIVKVFTNILLIPYYFYQKTSRLLSVFFFSTGFYILTAVPMIYFWGIKGAAVATIIAKISQIPFLLKDSKVFFTFSFSMKSFVLPTLFVFIVSAATSIAIINNNNNTIIQSLLFVTVLIIVYLSYKSKLLNLYKSHKSNK